jgi:hypothetical protein
MHPGAELFISLCFSLCKEVTEAPPVKFAAMTAAEFGNRAHFATGWHFVEGQV